jgi:hypothetical protein
VRFGLGSSHEEKRIFCLPPGVFMNSFKAIRSQNSQPEVHVMPFHGIDRKSKSRAHPKLEALETRLVPSLFKLSPIVQVSGLSPFAGNNADAGQPGINFLNSEVEPSLAADPTNPSHLIAAWQQDRWSNTGCRGIVTSTSFNGGNTWSPLTVVPGLTLVSGGTLQRTSDPWLSISTNGTAYLSSNPFDITDGNETMSVNKSTDGGLTWGAPTAVITDTAFTVIDDKESVTADPTNPNNIYVTFERLVIPSENANPRSFVGTHAVHGPTWFARSTDGGNTYEPARIIFDPGSKAQTLGNVIVVEPNGDLVDAFDLIIFNGNNGNILGTNVAVIRSTDQGLTWSAPTIVSSLSSIRDTDPNTGQPLRTGNIIPQVTVDNSNGNLYVVWEDARFSGGAHNDIAFSRSTDEGQTWSTPIKVNQTPSNIPVGDQQAFTASVAVGGDGTIAVTYYDLRNNTGGPGLATDFWINHVDPGNDPTNPASWSNEQRLTVNSFNMELAPQSNSSGSGFFVGDYESLQAFGKGFTNFGALFATTTATDPANVYFRDPPAAAAPAPEAVFVQAEEAKPAINAPTENLAEKPAVVAFEPKLLMPTPFDDGANGLALSANEHHIAHASTLTSAGSDDALGTEALDTVFASEE